MTLFPFAYWKKTHALHHATSGNLDRRVLGDIRTLTVAEYRARSWWGRFGYRFYRSMPVMLLHRVRATSSSPSTACPRHAMVLEKAVAQRGAQRYRAHRARHAASASWLGWSVFLAIQLPVVAIAGACGVWLFYVQHNFEGGYWARGADWNARRAAVEGSSFYDLPAVLRWFTANIGYHHIHHLAPRIPNYHLRAAHETMPAMAGLRRLTLRDSFASSRMKLWDEGLGLMVGYPDRALSP